MFKKFIFNKRTWSTLIVATHITGTNCVYHRSLHTPRPTTATSIDDINLDMLDLFMIDITGDNLNSESSSSSEGSSDSSSSGVSSGCSSLGTSSGYSSSGTSSGYSSSGSGVSSGSAYSTSPPLPTTFAGLPKLGTTCFLNA